MTTASTIEETGHVIGVRGSPRPRGWLRYVVRRRLKRAVAKARAKREAGAYADVAPEERARSVVRWACAKAALTGTLSGTVATGAIVATAQTDGLAGIVALPLATVVVGGEMVARAVVHVDLACELAEIFGLSLEGDDDDVVRLLALAVGTPRDAQADDPGRAGLASATEDREALFEDAATLLLGESVLRNVLPFVGIASSAITNVVVTRRLGRTLRRSFRYERAVTQALDRAAGSCAPCIDLLIEGLWFVFIADGRLTPEETICLARRLDELDDRRRGDLLARFVADETDWLERLPSVPDEARDAFLRVLEVAAALDKSLVLPEEKIIRRVADAFHRSFDARRVQSIVEQLEETGLLT